MALLLTELCFRLSHDTDDHVRFIGQQCLRSYDEFAGLRYAGLTAFDASHLAAAARKARAHRDTTRAQLLDEAVRVVRGLLPN
ncbi:MAG TPA: hypothetical protein VFW98_09435 [Gemmatimonadaceae bacterium]|nr:hypothetical protein [Gemmatimonadaceae bacterium]